jgi:DNA invertase Pin-like site-specific DNA recombinase
MNARTKEKAAAPPQRAVVLARISDARNGDEAGVTDQVADGRKLARRLGWKIGPEASHILIENDTSAYKRRKIALPDGRVELRTVRPRFRRALDLLASGEADGLIAVDLDRTARDPRDLEDLIDVVEGRTPRIPVESVTGSLALASDGDVTMARVLCAVANKSSRDTARRVRRARERQATEGRFGGGARRYGHELDGTVREEEAVHVRDAAEAVLAGVGLNGIATELNARGVPAPKGKRWRHQSLRDLLLQPRLAGLMAFEGEVLEGVDNLWQPIISRSDWEAAVAVLSSPSRRTTPGPQPRHLLSHLARCGHPSHPADDRPPMIKSSCGGGAGRPKVDAYRCRDSSHLSCAQQPLDDYVADRVVERLSRRDALKNLTRPSVDVTGLARKANSLRARIGALGDALEAGDMGAVEYRQRKGRLAEQLSDVEGQLTAAAGTSPLVDLAGQPDAGELWDGLDLARQRAVIDTLMEVVVLPAESRGKSFDAGRVRIDWRAPW